MTNPQSLSPTVTAVVSVKTEVPPRPAASPHWGRVLVLFFLLALFVPPFLFGGNEYRLNQITRYAALALFALSVDVIWGYTGLLSLGQGLYFGLGAYAVGYSLILQQAAVAEDLPFVYSPDMARPDYMVQCRLPEVPIWIGQLINIWVALGVAVIVPTLIAALFGYVVFRRGIKGVYFSLITQAVLMAVFTLVSNQRPYTGGVDGLTNLADLRLFGFEFQGSYYLYFLVTGILVLCFLACAALMASKFGRILTAIRDSENRVLALGYNTAMYKTFAFALSAGMAGLAGGLFVAANSSAGPQFFSIADSIEVVIFVAVGGRGTLVGAILGAVLVNVARTYANEHWREIWPILLGGLFVVVVAFMPDGIVGLFRRLAARLTGGRAAREASA